MPTKLGLHVAFGSRKGYGLVAEQAPAVVIAVGEGGALVEARQKSSGRTVTIYREQKVFHDAPNGIDHMTVAEARQTADAVWPSLKAGYDKNPADYYQVTNETGGDNVTAIENLFAFETRLMELAERDGYKLAVASPAGGSPGSWDIWVNQFVPHIRRAGEGGHIYSRHAYGGVQHPDQSTTLTVPGPQPADDNAGRPFREAAYLRAHGILTPMVITEAGQNAGYLFPGKSVFMEDMRRYDQLCQAHDNIWGFCSWTYGNYQNRPANIEAASQAMADYLRDAGGAVRPVYPAPAIVTTTQPDPVDETPEEVEAEDLSGFERAFVRFENSVEEYTNVQGGRQFNVRWTIRNSGSKPWRGDFRLAYLDSAVPFTESHPRSRFGAQASYTLKELTGRSQIDPDEEVVLPLQFVAPQQLGWYASHWGLQTASGASFGAPLWMRIKVTSVVTMPDPKPAGAFQPGMNLNPDAHALDIDRLKGLHWVRFVYKASAKNRNVDQAFQDQYQALIQQYTNAGIKCLIILNQETVTGNAPWDNGNWGSYAVSFGQAAGRVAELCAPFGANVAFQLWNEEDSLPENTSAIGVSAVDFAPLVGEAARAIRAAAPEATIVVGGLNRGPEFAVDYMRTVRQALGGSLPVDALAYHPYGRFVHNDFFHNKAFGTMQHAFDVFRNAFPDLPLWITEIGVAADTPIGPEHYENIARYMREIFTEIADNRTDHVPVLIWFGWTDLMRNAGVLTASGGEKAHIYAAYKEMVARGAAPVDDEAISFGLTAAPQATFLNFTTTLVNHNAVPAGSTFTNRWTFKNSGGTVWDDSYRLVYVPEAGSAPMRDQHSYALSAVAAPMPAQLDDEITVALTMTAPEQAGRFYRSRWHLRDGDNKTFAHIYSEITTVPAPTAGTGVQRSDMLFIADHTIPDDTRVPEGESFLKQWRVRNSGVRHWGSGFRLVFVEGDLQMAQGLASHTVPQAARGDEVILTIPMVAPPARGDRPATYQSLWRLQDDRGTFFGKPVWTRIVSQPAGQTAPLGRYADTTGWYSQLDPRWRGLIVGDGQQTIGDWGCLLTCYTMMLHAYGLRLTPAEVNLRMREMGGCFVGSDVLFAAPPKLLAGLVQGRNLRSWPTPELPSTVWSGEDPIRRIDNALAKGYTVLAQVDRSPNNAYYHSNTEQHWVILVARTRAGDDYLILDPIVPAGQVQDQPRSLMRKYGSVIPSRSHEENLRNAIKSALIYVFDG